MNRQAATVAQEHMLLEPGTPVLLESSSSARANRWQGTKVEWRQAAGIALVLIGVAAMFIGWYRLSGSGRTSEQLSYFLSGGIGGGAALACGVALLISFEHVSDRATMVQVVERIDRLEYGVAAEIDALRADLGLRSPNGLG